ncbi:MAG: hypothetical protein Q7T26_13085 [Dehalococcoidia bacterium]|nr:hypothetical protein [Dehalococcoidia bacterium]
MNGFPRPSRRPRWGLPLVLALGLWLCTLPLVGLALALGLLPWQDAWPAVGLLLAGDLLACFVLCHTVLRGWTEALTCAPRLDFARVMPAEGKACASTQ